MAGTEIKVTQSELQIALQKLATLEQGHVPSDEPITSSSGEMASALNAHYNEFRRLEEQLLILFQKTRLALTQAGIDFQTVDEARAAEIKTIG